MATEEMDDSLTRDMILLYFLEQRGLVSMDISSVGQMFCPKGNVTQIVSKLIDQGYLRSLNGGKAGELTYVGITNLGRKFIISGGYSSLESFPKKDLYFFINKRNIIGHIITATISIVVTLFAAYLAYSFGWV